MSIMIPSWSCPPQPLSLQKDAVYVWRANVDITSDSLSVYQETLSEDELDRASRFHYQKDAQRFIARRGVLRSILGSTLGCPPEELCFAYDSYGKPSLIEGSSRLDLQFSTSHSEGLALVAIALVRLVGIDLEYIRPQVAKETIPEQFFAPAEVAVLRSLPADQQAVGFFNCWARKEAYVKAVGKGLSLPLDQFEVSVHPDKPASLLRTTEDSPAEQWWMCALDADKDYAAALVVQGRECQLKCWDWPCRLHGHFNQSNM